MRKSGATAGLIGRNVVRWLTQRIEPAVDWLSPAHPGFGPDAAYPVGETRDEPEVLDDMLLAESTGPARRGR